MLAAGLICSLVAPAVLASWLRALRRRPRPGEGGEPARPVGDPRRPTTASTALVINLLLAAGAIFLAPGVTRAALMARGSWWVRGAARLLGEGDSHPVVARADQMVRQFASLLPARPGGGDGLTRADAPDGGTLAELGTPLEPPGLSPLAERLDGGGEVPGGPGVRVAFEQRGSAIVVPVVLRGQAGEQRVKMLFDTGATLTSVNTATLHRLGQRPRWDDPEVESLTANGRVSRKLAVIEDVTIGGLRVGGGVAVTICDPCASGEVVGLLGLNVARHFKVTVDHEEGQLMLVPKAGPLGHLADIRHFVKITKPRGVWTGQHLKIQFVLDNRAPRALTRIRVMAEVRVNDQVGRLYGSLLQVSARSQAMMTIEGDPGVPGRQFSLKLVQARW
jgi:hypothetical protein